MSSDEIGRCLALMFRLKKHNDYVYVFKRNIGAFASGHRN